MSALGPEGFEVRPALFTRKEIGDRLTPHRARPTRGLQGRWSVVMWVKAGGDRPVC